MRTFRLYVEGFDDKVVGVPEGHIVLISGPPGTMKSSLAFNILYHQAKNDGVKGLYVTLEQDRKSLEIQLKGLGMDPKDVAELVSIQDFSRIRRGVQELTGTDRVNETGSPWMDVIKKHLLDIREEVGYELLVMDSLPVLETITDMKNRRIELFHIFGWLRNLGITTFIVHEISPDPMMVQEEDYLADGIFHLTMDRVGETDVFRRIRCVKMRGINHDTGYFTLEFKDGRFQVTKVI